MILKGRLGFFFVAVVCFCVVSSKNLDNARSKRTADSQNNCDNVSQFFSLKNVTVSSLDGTKGRFFYCCNFALFFRGLLNRFIYLILNSRLSINSIKCFYFDNDKPTMDCQIFLFYE